MRLSAILSALPAVFAVPSPGKRSEPAPLIKRGVQGNAIDNHWIVKFKNSNSLSSSSVSTINVLESLSISPNHVFNSVFQGFAGRLDATTLESLRNNPDVEYIEQDTIVKADEWIEQANAPWGLARISQRASLEVNSALTYTYDSSAGAGTCAYVIDSGIDTAHPEFEGRAFWAANFADQINEDGIEHGTHVAGIIGSKTYGVAKNTTIYSVKTIGSNGTGTTSQLIAGLDFVIQDAPKRNCPKGVVANVSIRDDPSAAVNAAAAALVANDIFLAVSAGNLGQDVSSQSPASEPTVCTVSSSDNEDQVSFMSNFGAGVDVYAPGTDILSTIPNSGTGVKSGTSMASPHAAGLAAYLAGLNGFPGADALCTQLKETASNGIIKYVLSGTPNKLIFNGNPSGESA